MTLTEFGACLRSMYDTPGANKTTMIHLFGVIYADEIKDSGFKPIEILRAAKMQESYQTEINKGMRLSQYVQLKPSYKGKFDS